MVVRCKEKQRFHVKGGTYFQTNEGAAQLRVGPSKGGVWAGDFRASQSIYQEWS